MYASLPKRTFSQQHTLSQTSQFEKEAALVEEESQDIEVPLCKEALVDETATTVSTTTATTITTTTATTAPRPPANVIPDDEDDDNRLLAVGDLRQPNLGSRKYSFFLEQVSSDRETYKVMGEVNGFNLL